VRTKLSTKPKRAKRKKNPKHTVITRAYDFVMEVSARQSGVIWMWLGACWRLRNGLVSDRSANRAENRELKAIAALLETEDEILFTADGSQVFAPLTTHYLTQADQYKAVPEYVRRDTALSKVHSQVRQNVVVRIAEGYKRYFDAVKEGRKNVQLPHFIEFKKYRSFTFPQYGPAAHIKNSKLHLSGLGEFALYDYRKVKGKPKTVTVKFKQGRWHCIVTAECQEKDRLPVIQANDERPDGGIDTGLTALMTDSEGNDYDPPKAWRKYRRQLASAQRVLSRKFEFRKLQHEALAAKAKAESKPVPSLKDIPYSNRLKAQIRKVAKLHTKVENTRDYGHKKGAAIVADRFRYVGVEEHGVQFMIRNRRQAEAASDRAIHKQKLALKSALGKRYIPAPNRTENGGNSQVCTCGAPAPKELSDRIHKCTQCGLVADRDHVSANIVTIILFGCASLSLAATEAGQVSGRRGEGEDLCGESRQGEPQSTGTLEPPMKRQPSAALRQSADRRRQGNTIGGGPTVGDKTGSASSVSNVGVAA
jgi:transposase